MGLKQYLDQEASIEEEINKLKEEVARLKMLLSSAELSLGYEEESLVRVVNIIREKLSNYAK